MGIASTMFVALVIALWWAVAGRHWVVGLIAVVLLIGMFHDNRVHEDEAARYRAAQEAVANATGRPCDYQCKAMIADQARRRQIN